METINEINEIVTNDEVKEVAEEIATTVVHSRKGFGKKAAATGLALLVGGLVYKYAVKPVIAKAKAKKEQREAVEDTIKDLDEDTVTVDYEVNETDNEE